MTSQIGHMHICTKTTPKATIEILQSFDLTNVDWLLKEDKNGVYTFVFGEEKQWFCGTTGYKDFNSAVVVLAEKMADVYRGSDFAIWWNNRLNEGNGE